MEIIKFPDGHKHLKIAGNELLSEKVEISIRSFDDLFLLAQYKTVNKNLKYLRINYLLGARFDRKFSSYDSLDLKIIADFINNLNFEKVEILKPHSDVSLALINNSESISLTSDIFIRCIEENKIEDYSIIVPDAGASKWVEKELGSSYVIQCYKDRNTSTGEINVIKFAQTPKETCIIVDDLCDGGATFINIAKQLKEKGVKNIYLVVTHGIFSKGFRVFDGLINKIYCTNSFGIFEDNLLRQSYYCNNIWN